MEPWNPSSLHVVSYHLSAIWVHNHNLLSQSLFETIQVPLSNPLFTSNAKMSMSIEECQTPRPGFPKPVPDGPSNVMDQFSMKGKIVIVTGAAEGIGGAVADAIAEAGGDVALWYNS